MANILLIDIGGTNIRFAWSSHGRIGKISSYKTILFQSPIKAIDFYLSQTNKIPQHMILGVAGPTNGETVQMTNKNWNVSKRQLIKKYCLKSCLLVNDFILKGYGLLSLSTKNIISLNKEKAEKYGQKCLIGPGTGLGVCCLIHHQSEWIAQASEAGHSNICAKTPLQQQILHHISSKNISAEDVLSGRGLASIYQALFYIKNNTDVVVTPEEVCQLACQGNDLAIKTYLCFFDFLSAFATNMAIIFHATGGIYLSSSIFNHPQILGLLKKHPIHMNIIHKHKLGNWLTKIPIFVITEDNLAFKGLKNLSQLIEKQQKQ